jgi:integrase
MARPPTGRIESRTLADGRRAHRLRVEFPPDPLTGNRRQRNRTIYGSKEHAERVLRKWLRELDEGVAIERHRDTVTDLLERWVLEDAAPRVKAKTLQDYVATLNTHVIPRIGHKQAQSLTPDDVTRFVAQVSREAGSRTTQLALLRLKQALAWGTRVELLHRNVADRIQAPKGSASEARAMTHSEARSFLDAAKSDTYWPLWLVYLSTGLRRGEALGMKWGHLDLDKGFLSVKQTVNLVKQSDGHVRPVLGEPKTQAAFRTLDIDAKLTDALQVAAGNHKEQFGPANLVFCTRHGTLLNPTNLYRNMHAICDEAGLGPWKVHELRHTHATHLLLAGVPFEVVSKRLGHANSSITLRTYSHLLPGSGELALAAIEQALYGASLPELDG